MSEHLMDLDQICSWLNRFLEPAKLSAAPCPWLSAISIFVDERYENYEYDVLGPRARRLITRALKESGFRRRGARVFVGAEGRIKIPRPARSLSSDPSPELDEATADGRSTILATPTQVVFLTLRCGGRTLPPDREQDLLDLVCEHPANLDKVRDWLRRSNSEATFHRLRPRLAERQERSRRRRRKRASGTLG